HQFNRKEDIEIAGFLTAVISWGQRKTILNNANQLLKIMDFCPYDFVINARDHDFTAFESFKHRTFNGIDCIFFMRGLQHIYLNHGGMENAFKAQGDGIKSSIMHFRSLFFSIPHPSRTLKHLADPAAGASAKRINMFLRWMVRKDDRGVDFGIWNTIKPSQLYCPLDIHTGNVARKLGLITRRQNDWKALEELMAHLKSFDSEDPVKYDFALFGLGIFENF
ncbi:MAG: TIGR02757 family protein, partial [Bacteroidales bacterium]|nr:TIGR02757 family protein [Bacteroidales bacterium]